MAVVTSVMRAQQLFLGQVEAVLRPHGLTFSRYEVLRLLAFSRRGMLPVGKIGERLQVHPASVTNAVQRLESAGLVLRHRNPDDGRGVLAEITGAGTTLVERCTVDVNEQVFTPLPLSSGERDDLFRIVRRLRLAAGDFGDDTAP